MYIGCVSLSSSSLSTTLACDIDAMWLFLINYANVTHSSRSGAQEGRQEDEWVPPIILLFEQAPCDKRCVCVGVCVWGCWWVMMMMCRTWCARTLRSRRRRCHDTTPGSTIAYTFALVLCGSGGCGAGNPRENGCMRRCLLYDTYVLHCLLSCRHMYFDNVFGWLVISGI